MVVAEAGRLGTPPLFAIADATGGLPVRLADGQVAPPRGAIVEVRGTIAAPYGQTELRLAAGGLMTLGTGTLQPPMSLQAGAIGEGVEGRLVAVHGTITTGAAKATSGDLSFTIRGGDGATLRIYADASSRLTVASFRKGVVATFTGLVGQHASRKDTLDGYRLWLRDAADVAVAPSPSPSASPSPSPSPSAGTVPAVESIATARVRDGDTVTVEGVVTVDRSLLDASGRRAVIEDATAAIELYLAAPDTAIHEGVRVRVTGSIGRAWGAPRLHAARVTVLGRVEPVVHDLRVAPGATTEWRLVRLTGTIASLHRTGDRWVAELTVGSLRVPILGLAGSRIPATALGEGRTATITGIVKRPYPSAVDRRFAVVPRGIADLVVGAAPASPGTGPGGGVSAGPGGASGPGGGSTTTTGGGTAPDTDLRDLSAQVGREVRVGGLVTEIEADGFRLDDGTGSARVILAGDAADLVAVLGPGDAVNAEGAVELRDEAVIVVRDAAALVLVGDLGTGGDAASSPSAGALVVLSSNLPALSVVSASRAGRIDVVGIGAGTVGLAALAAIFAAVVRRRRDRRLLQARIVARLASFGAPEAVATASGTAPRAPVDA